MSITTTTIILTKVSINNSPFQAPDTIDMDQSEDAMSWEASFTITIGNHLLLPEASDIVFVPYRGVVLYSTVVTLFVIRPLAKVI